MPKDTLRSENEANPETCCTFSISPEPAPPASEKIIEFICNDLRKEVNVTVWHIITFGILFGAITSIILKPCNGDYTGPGQANDHKISNTPAEKH